METLKVVTLNCWGIPIPGISKMRSQRMQAIGQELSKGEYDIVVLEEIWSQEDYKRLCADTCNALPYTHYFYSGPIGSGICVFSKLPIQETFFHRFHLNGQAYKVQHGDWFGGKGVGLCKLNYKGLKVNLYLTHIHAEYNRKDDEYLAHRLSQTFEMSQFIRLTAVDCDVVIAAGDFNVEPSDLGYKLLLTNTPLWDAWTDKKNVVDFHKSGGTCECPWNMFRDTSLEAEYPEGKRIDYILYCGQPGVDVTVDKCEVTLGKVPGKDFPFSDHEGVAAHFRFSKIRPGEQRKSQPVKRREDSAPYIRAARDVLLIGMDQVQRSVVRFQLKALVLAIVLWLLNGTDLAQTNPQPVPLIMGVVKLGLATALAALLWLSLVVKRGESQGLLATRLDIEKLLEDKAKLE